MNIAPWALALCELVLGGQVSFFCEPDSAAVYSVAKNCTGKAFELPSC